MSYWTEYKSKLRTPQEAVQVIQSGDWVEYTLSLAQPYLLDKALAARKDELTDIKVRGMYTMRPLEILEADPNRETFTYSVWQMSGLDRKYQDRGLCSYQAGVYRYKPVYYRNYLHVDVAMLCVAPMDDEGYFSFSYINSSQKAICDAAKIVIVEINHNLKKVYGGFDDKIHISEVDFIVEGVDHPLPEIPPITPNETDKKIAENILPYIPDGANLQLGIGGMPNVIGQMLAKSDLKDLGMYTEMTCDGFVDLAEAGKLTDKYNRVGNGRGVWSVAMGSHRVHEWVAENSAVASFPVDFVNSPRIMSENDNLTCIVNCVSLDLFSQFSSESSGTRQISGTGGQVDFVEGAFESRGGQCFIALSSTRKDKEGNLQSRIVPTFKPGEIVSVPRSLAFYAVTEYGVVNLAGKSTWERAEAVISLAHPDFREDLIREAEKMNIWRKSNKRG
ncbi:MAG: butyryl-CoA:acetate CoA-transferase [Firmicutes bacterium]|nr:butyryl-CoA:acetate CoA-transferase [Bacillota bacterium]